VRRGESVVGYVDVCPHAGWPLAAAPDRYLTREGDRIFCAGHGAVFRISDGECTFGPCAGQSLKPWPVTVDANGVVATG
jgi:nitrite reductase/ring-hydroxylating ferredoxin subunit